jgi:hypothetical protein
VICKADIVQAIVFLIPTQTYGKTGILMRKDQERLRARMIVQKAGSGIVVTRRATAWAVRLATMFLSWETRNRTRNKIRKLEKAQTQ